MYVQVCTCAYDGVDIKFMEVKCKCAEQGGGKVEGAEMARSRTSSIERGIVGLDSTLRSISPTCNSPA